MSLSEIDKTTVAQWVQDGASLAEVQRRLANDLGQNLTYMEVRFLLDDLDIELLAPPPPPPAEEEAEALPVEDVGKVTVSLDRITRPGALISGSVTFSDGQTATWFLDQSGRLGLDPATKGYKPSDQDVQDFQTELQALMRKQGY